MVLKGIGPLAYILNNRDSINYIDPVIVFFSVSVIF